MATKVTVFRKTGNVNEELYPITTDDRVIVTSDNNKLPYGITSLADLIDSLGNLAFEDYVALNVSSETNYGLVKMSNTDSDATDTVPTSKYIHDNVVAPMVTTTGSQTISGVKTFSNGLNVGSSEITYDSANDKIIFGAMPEEEEEP